ncbi:MAG: HD domain-containing protein [Armatimonadetes bacterium]|nr:HD domain-containing protein [Armatimonadota bacterium]
MIHYFLRIISAFLILLGIFYYDPSFQVQFLALISLIYHFYFSLNFKKLDEAKETKYILSELEEAYKMSRKEAQIRHEREISLADKTKKLHTLAEITRLMNQAKKLDELLKLIVTSSKEELNTQIGFLMLIKKNSLNIVYSLGLSEESQRIFSANLGEGILGKTALDGRAVRLSEQDNQLKSLIGVSEKIKNLLCVPMLSPQDKMPIGILGVANLIQGNSFDKEQEEYLATLATDAAIYIKNKILLENLEKSYLEMIKVLAQAVEVRDPYTSGHIERVQDYAVEIAKKLKLSQTYTEFIKSAAILHDVGKIGTPDQILLKAGPLDIKEREEMNKHVLTSVGILRDISSLNKEVLDLVKHHHEKYDGSGYPDRLEGENIPLGAQIIAIADTFDAMTTDRPYRKGFPKEEALKEIKGLAGTQFNPRVVEVFLASFSNYNNTFSPPS